MGWKYFIESTTVFSESLYFYRHKKCYSLPGISEKNHINHFAHLTRCADHNTDLPSSSNISKTVRVNIGEKNHINHFAHLTRCADHNTDLPSSSNISKTVRVNIVFTEIFCKEYSISFLMIARLIDLWFSRYWCLKFAGLFESQKSRFLNFSGTDPADNHTFKVNIKNTRTRCEICSKLTITTPERRHWCHCQQSPVLLLLTLSR